MKGSRKDIVVVEVLSGVATIVQHPRKIPVLLLDWDLPESGVCPLCYRDLMKNGKCECGYEEGIDLDTAIKIACKNHSVQFGKD